LFPPLLEWRSFCASYPPPFSPGDPANLSFAPLSILLYFIIFSFTHLFWFSIRPTFPFPISIFRTIYSSKYFSFEN
jgi:hypothetical protein